MPLSGFAQADPRAALIAQGRQALVRSDGILGEAKLRAAMQQGAPREAVAADMGEAYLLQGDRDRARAWLSPARFTSNTAAQGFRRLGRLLQMDGNLPEAGKAFDRALAITPDDAGLWVEIGRLRYKGGQHELAIAAAERAVAIDPHYARALQFRGQLVRDRYGLLASIPWFESAILQAPNDVDLLGDYAATLGELGRAGEMLVVTRRMLALDGGNAQAYYLQAVMAARAGRFELARTMLDRTRGRLADQSGVMLLEGVLQLSAGNTDTATGVLEQLLARRPDVIQARQLLARAMYLGGRYADLVARFNDEAARGDASPYLVTLVARAYEALGNRDQAGSLLDRAAMPQAATLRVLPGRTRIGALLAQGRSADAQVIAENTRVADPGFYDNQSLAGDAQFAAGHAAAAQQRYLQAAKIRMSDSLLLRRFEAYAAAGDRIGATGMVEIYLAQDPANRVALRLLAALALEGGDPPEAAAILDYLRRSGSASDVQLLSDLAFVQVGLGDAGSGESNAETAYRLQRANPLATQALALSYVEQGVRPAQAGALLDKARRMLGDNSLLAAARRRLVKGEGGG